MVYYICIPFSEIVKEYLSVSSLTGLSQSDTTTISTPAGMHIVTVALTQGTERLHTFDVEVCYGPGDVAVVTLQTRTLVTALANPGLLVDEGRVAVMANITDGVVVLYLPMESDYALLYLPMESARAFAETAQVSASSKWATAIDTEIQIERALDAHADEGFTALTTWLAVQG